MFSRNSVSLLFLALGCELAAAASVDSPVGPHTPISYTLRHLTTADGLPQNTVRCLLRSRQGCLWVATSDGLARYDGLTFTTYFDEFLATDGGDSRILDLEEDGLGRIWVRTGDGLARFETGRWTVFPEKAPPLGEEIFECRASRQGGVWLTMPDGLKRFDHGRIVQHFSTADGLPQNNPSLAGEDDQGGLWLGFGPEGKRQWQRLDPKTGRLTRLETLVSGLKQGPEHLRIASSGGIWVCGRNEFMKVLGAGPGVHVPAPAGLTETLTHFAADDAGVVWFTRAQQPYLFGLRSDGLSAGDLPKLPSDDLRCIAVGPDGIIWVGTGDEGLVEFRPRPFTSLLTTNSSGQRQEVYSICAGGEGRIWFGTSDGLVLQSRSGWKTFTNSWRDANGRYENSVRSVVEDHDGRVWFGVRDQGLNTLSNGHMVAVPAASCGATDTWTVSSLLLDRAGDLWIGSGVGLVRRAHDGDFECVSTKLGLPAIQVSGLAQAPDGAIWIGTAGAGLYRLAGSGVTRFTTHEGLSSDVVCPLCADADGAVWLGTPRGLNRLVGNRVSVITTGQGLPGNQIYALLDDSHGCYWATCNRGVCRIPRSELQAAADRRIGWLSSMAFLEADGLASTECNGECQPSVAQAPDGRLWFSTTRGCGVVDPGSFAADEAPPQVSIEKVLVDDQLIFKEGALTFVGAQFSAAGGLRLPPGHGRVLEIRYSASDFLNPRRVRFSCRLDGHDPAWRDAGTQRVAIYTDVPPGDYVFELRARNELGALSSNVATFGFTLAPRFWQTWTFYGISALAFAGMVGGMQAYRLRWQHRLHRIEQQRSLANERARIARDLHDDLGTSLTGLALELDVIGRAGANASPLFEKLSQSARLARELADRMREVVWSINPRCDTVLSLATYLDQQVARFLGSDQFRVRLKFPEEIPSVPLGAEARHQLALSLREALTNIVRHAQATEVEVTLEVAQGCLAVEIADNGVGFPDTARRGQGLTNMRGRMELIGAEFHCDSQPGRGTTVRFRVPLQPSDAGKGIG